MRKYLAEFIGTMVLVLFACGAAVFAGDSLGVLGIAFGFGLVIVAMAYSIGPISGCHINPAVSFAMLINKRINVMDFIGYVISQFAGGFCGAALIWIIKSFSDVSDEGFGQNSFGKYGMFGAFVIEVILTFVFVLTIMGVTSKKNGNSNNAGIVIGFALVLVHLLGINLTGTSVNPARSFGPALFAGGDALSQLWVFIAAPLVGAAIAAIVAKFLLKTEEG